MKRILLLLAAGSLALSAQSNVTATKHNLSSVGATAYTTAVTNYTQVCKFCHSPHGAQAGTDQIVPLWGHKTTAQTFTMYASASLKGTMDTTPSGPSLACLSCHDGTVAVNARYTYADVAPGTSNRGTYGNATAGLETGTDFTVTTDLQGRRLAFLAGSIAGATKDNLSTIHPVGVTYVNNPELVNSAALTGVKLFAGKVQCASCHEPHGGTGQSMFLRLSTSGSALCLACHIK